jgi:hypothetical protein
MKTIDPCLYGLTPVKDDPPGNKFKCVATAQQLLRASRSRRTEQIMILPQFIASSRIYFYLQNGLYPTTTFNRSNVMLGRYCAALKVLLVGLFLGHQAVSQTMLSSRPVWSDIHTGVTGTYAAQTSASRALKLDRNALANILATTPLEGAVALTASRSKLAIPLPDGTMESFLIVESSIMAPELGLRYPEIQTYSGQGITDRTATIRLDVTPSGFHAMILSAAGTVYIDPATGRDADEYISYYKRDFAQLPNRRFEEIGIADPNGENAREIARLVEKGNVDRIGEQLRTYRLALACTGEYAAFHGGTVSGALAAMVTAMNRVNGVYERELAIRMVLIPNNDQIIFTNAATDPYTNTDGGAMLDQNQTTLDNIIGPANYDVGHVFSTGGGGIAGLGVVCRSNQKAWGVTGLSQPIGDPFYIDYVAHEMGHQFGANHPFNSVTSSCGGGNRNASTAYEPGSGSTIMAYAGICGGDDLQSNSDDYFHIISIDEIAAYTTAGSGNSCAVITATGNNAPVVTVGASGTTIPKGTPFFLNGSATDADNDTLTFTWEEFDLGPAGSPNSPTGNAPTFRSFAGTTNSSRTFPRLASLISNTQTIGELLPTYARTMTFRLTARDNRSNGGGVGRSSAITIGVNSTAGPFTVSRPNQGGSWLSGTIDTVRWDVAGTDVAPINCTSVNILLSTDGGLTFPSTLSAATPNDGSEAIVVPAIFTESARIKIEAVNNIFFDISNLNFAISSVAAPALVSPPENFQSPANQLTLRWSPVATATGYHVQVATNVNFTSPQINDSTVTDTARALTGLTNNATYYWRVRSRTAATRSGWSPYRSFRVLFPPAAPTLSAPTNGAVNMPTSLTLRWNVVIGATGFHVQVATDSLMTSPIVDDSGLTTIQRPVVLGLGNRYFWRTRARNNGGWGPYSSIWNFATTLTSVEERQDLPERFSLSQNYPNPFNPSTQIAFGLPREGSVTLEVYSLLGQRVATLVSGDQHAGFHSVTFDASGLASGMYFYRLKAVDRSGASFVQTRSLVVMR